MRLIKRVDNVFLYEIEQIDYYGQILKLYKIICPWGTFFTYHYQDALNQFNNWIEDLK